MKYIGSLVAVILTTAMLTGCSANSIKSDYKFIAGSNKGLLVLSATHDDKPGISNTNAHFYINKKGEDNSFQTYQSVADKIGGGLGLGILNKKSDFSDVNGVLYVVELDAGTHELTRWSILTPSGVSFYPKENPPTLSFEILENKITYIGNLHMRLSTGKNVIGYNVIGSGLPEIKNKSERDLNIFKNRYPQFNDSDINLSVLKEGAWYKNKEIIKDIPVSQGINK